MAPKIEIISSIPRKVKKTKRRKPKVKLTMRVPQPYASGPRSSSSSSSLALRSIPRSLKLHSSLAAYLKTLSDPFAFPGVPLGFATSSAGGLVMAYNRTTYKVLSGTDGIQVALNPDNAGVLSAGSGLAAFLLNNFGWYTTFNNVGAALSTTPLQPTAAVAINASYTAYRIISAGLRVSVSYPMTSTGPLLTGLVGRGFESTTAADNIPPSSGFTYLSSITRPCNGGSGSMNVTWRPQDYDDLSFSRMVISSNGGGLYNPLMIFIAGLPVGSLVAIECIAHIECLIGSHGLAAPVSDLSSSDSPTVAEEISQDGILRYIRDQLPSQETMIQAIEDYGPSFFSSMVGALNSQNPVYSGRSHQGMLQSAYAPLIQASVLPSVSVEKKESDEDVELSPLPDNVPTPLDPLERLSLKDPEWQKITKSPSFTHALTRVSNALKTLN